MCTYLLFCHGDAALASARQHWLHNSVQPGHNLRAATRPSVAYQRRDHQLVQALEAQRPAQESTEHGMQMKMRWEVMYQLAAML
jgi:hypothetical protein